MEKGEKPGSAGAIPNPPLAGTTREVGKPYEVAR